MRKGPLNSVATKNKGKATITAIKYSAPNRVRLFSFYNHSQPLWVWADGTSISSGKLNLHVDVGGRVKASIKRRRKQSRKGGDWDKGQELDPPRPCRGENLLGQARFTLVRVSWTPWLTTIRRPRLNLLAHSLQILLFGPFTFEPNTPIWGRYKSSPYNWRHLWEGLYVGAGGS